VIETRIDGRPADLSAAAAYLTEVLGDGIDQLADRVTRERSAATGGWRGQAADAFADRAAALACSADGVAASARTIGREVQALADVLEGVQAAMAGVRAEARAAGLHVTGTVIQQPAPALSFVGSATNGPLPIIAYGAARGRAAELHQAWGTALTESAHTLDSQRVTVAQVTRDLLAGGYRAWLDNELSPVLHGQARFLTDEARRALDDLAELSSDLHQGRIQPYPGVYDDIDDLRRLAAEADEGAATYLRTADRFATVGTVLDRAGPALALYGVYDDVQRGESIGQAALSQGASAAAGGITTSVLIGAAAGSPFPVVGSVIGAGIGAAAGIAANKGVDHLYRRHEERRERIEEEEREQRRRRDEQRVRNLIAISEGRPPWTEPWMAHPTGAGR
jgi:uncharacterized protein YukE